MTDFIVTLSINVKAYDKDEVADLVNDLTRYAKDKRYVDVGDISSHIYLNA